MDDVTVKTSWVTVRSSNIDLTTMAIRSMMLLSSKKVDLFDSKRKHVEQPHPKNKGFAPDSPMPIRLNH